MNINAHASTIRNPPMTDLRDRSDNDNGSVGECGVCGIGLPVGANHAYTVCGHLFCISCLLKWHNAAPRATCPMCRTPLYECEAEAEGAMQARRHDHDHDPAATETNRILEEMDFNLDEEIMHDHLMEVIELITLNYCRTNPGHAYMGHVHLHIVPKEDGNHHYERIDVGSTNPKSHYIVELIDAARAVRFRFGRIEEIIPHHLFPDAKWYAFRERIDRIDEERAQIITEWASEIQHIAVDSVKVLRHYLPTIRTTPTNQ